ncbi:hypothetical protein PGB90_002928 [Kerria lacca]
MKGDCQYCPITSVFLFWQPVVCIIFLTNDTCFWTDDDEANVITEAFQTLSNTGFHAAQEAVTVRDNFKNYFISQSGSVD